MWALCNKVELKAIDSVHNVREECEICVETKLDKPIYL